MHFTTTDTFDQDVQSAPVVLVEFMAPWCGACRQLEPLLERFAYENTNVLILKVDSDQNSYLTRQWKVMGLPTLLVFRGGRLAGRFVGNPGSVRALAQLVGPA